MNTKDIDELFIFKQTCEKCGHKWFPRSGKPQRCPRCQMWFSELVGGKETQEINEVPTEKSD